MDSHSRPYYLSAPCQCGRQSVTHLCGDIQIALGTMVCITHSPPPLFSLLPSFALCPCAPTCSLSVTLSCRAVVTQAQLSELSFYLKTCTTSDCSALSRAGLRKPVRNCASTRRWRLHTTQCDANGCVRLPGLISHSLIRWPSSSSLSRSLVYSLALLLQVYLVCVIG